MKVTLHENKPENCTLPVSVEPPFYSRRCSLRGALGTVSRASSPDCASWNNSSNCYRKLKVFSAPDDAVFQELVRDSNEKERALAMAQTEGRDWRLTRASRRLRRHTDDFAVRKHESDKETPCCWIATTKDTPCGSTIRFAYYPFLLL